MRCVVLIYELSISLVQAVVHDNIKTDILFGSLSNTPHSDQTLDTNKNEEKSMCCS